MSEYAGGLHLHYRGSFGNRPGGGPSEGVLAKTAPNSTVDHDSWGPERAKMGWFGPPHEEGGNWEGRDGPMMPPGNIISGRGPPHFGEGRGRSGFGRAPDFGPRGRGNFGRFPARGGRWNGEAEFEVGRGPGYRDEQVHPLNFVVPLSSWTHPGAEMC